MGFLALLMFVVLISSIVAPAATQNRSRCSDPCGNLTIPYPFGFDECYLSPEFLITCNDSFSPPQPFLRKSNIKVTNITLDGKLEIATVAARDCYNQSGAHQPGFRRHILNLSNFTISKSRNKFTVIGCGSYAYLEGFRHGKLYASGCMSFCAERGFVDENSCSGSGCCQTQIPDGLYSSNITAYSFYNHTNVSDFNPCTYAFIVEDSKFNFSFKYLQNISNTTEFPMVLDWSIKYNTSACKDHAQRYRPPDNVSGYLCKCETGYQGNPYVGCQDIDECENENDCTNKCTNTIGSYTCSCPKGYHGDGRKGGKGCTPNQLSLVKITLGIGIGFTALVVTASWLYLVFRKRKLIKLKEKFFRQNGGAILQQKLSRREGTPDHTAKIFTAEELKKATDNYDENTIIGKGGFGTVYKGILTDNRLVAIKKSITVDQNQIEQFINEVVVLSQINHKNVVRLLGCCLETPVPLLVYEFITNGTLFDHIHNESNGLPALSWHTRLKIAAEMAGALSYLHSAASVPIIHRDVKTTNILLDADYTAKVSDFGASRLVPLDKTQLSTMMQGTLGYLDPEYLLTSQLTDKSDVYSFGVILVELLTSMKALCFDRPEEERSLAMYFLSSVKRGKLFEVLDSRITNQGKEEQIEEVARLATSCLRLKGEERPSMKEVAMELEGLRMVEVHTWPQVNPEETEHLLGEQYNDFGHGDDSTASASYDSMKNHVILSVGDGR